MGLFNWLVTAWESPGEPVAAVRARRHLLASQGGVEMPTFIPLLPTSR